MCTNTFYFSSHYNEDEEIAKEKTTDTDANDGEEK